jgi:hypothetical protein
MGVVPVQVIPEGYATDKSLVPLGKISPDAAHLRMHLATIEAEWREIAAGEDAMSSPGRWRRRWREGRRRWPRGPISAAACYPA